MDQTASLAQTRKLLGLPVGIDYEGGVYIGMKKLVLIPIVLAVTVLAGFPVVFASQSTPFNGSFSGSFTMTSQTTATITGTGQLEHLGKTTFVALATVTGPASCQGGFTATEQDTFTAANGDKLFSSSNDVACPTSATTFHFAGSWSITGGTGRFEHSSGTGSVDVTGVETSSTSDASRFSGAIMLSVSISPSNGSSPTIHLSPNKVTLSSGGTASAVLTVTTTGTTSLGSYTVTIQGANGNLSHSATLSLLVQ